MSDKKINIIIADDHKIFRKGLIAALSDFDTLNIIGEAEDGNELIKLVDKLHPDIIISDIKMPNMDGIEALKKLKSTYDDIKIIMLTMYENDNFILALMELGANSYLIKNSDPDEIRIAIKSVYESGFYFNDVTSKALLKKIANSNQIKKGLKHTVELTDREKKVLQLICKEYTNSEIAQEIFLSPRTVEGIRSVLIEKLGVRNTAGLVLYAFRHQIVI